MEMQLVESKNISSIGFINGELRVIYKDGSLYRWIAVNESHHDELMVAPSKGKYLHDVIEKIYGKGIRLSEHKLADKSPGFLVEDVTVHSNNPIKPDTPASKCPACGTDADGWEPPLDDPRYIHRREQEKELYNLKTDEEADAHFLRSQGFISICKCGISFYVPGSKATLSK